MTRQEEQLWDRWSRKREAPAFEALVAGHQAFVFDFARRVTGHDADAEDLAQEAFLELAEAPADRPPGVGLRAFLGRRVVLGGRMLKRASLTRARHEKGAAERRPRASTPALSAKADAEAALALLEPDDRHAIELRFLHDLPYEDIAHILGIERAAARMRIHRALKSLRRRLGEDAEAGVAALVLFSPPRQFVRNTVRTASLVGGAIAVTSVKKKLLIVLALVAAGLGAFAWRSGRDEQAETSRAPVQREPVAQRPEPDTASAPQPDAARAAKTAPRAQPIPPGKGSVAGRVTFLDGTPLRRTKLELWGSPTVPTETDDEGRFEIRGDWVGNRDLCIVGEDGFYFPIAHVEMEPDVVVRLDVSLDSGHALEGVVIDAATRNPVAGAAIRFDRPGARGAGVAQGKWGQVRTDARGRFLFRHVPKGHYVVTADFPGLESAFVELDVPGTTLQILLKPAREMRVRFENLPAAWQGAPVTIAIHSARGRPINTYQTRRIDGHGEVRIDAPPPGHYVVTRLNGNTPLPHFEKEFFVEPDEPPVLVVELPAGARVEGSFSPAEPKMTAWLQPHDLRARADEQGRFVFPFVPEGDSHLHVILGSVTLLVDRFEVPASGAVVRDVRLAGVTVRGRLVAEGDDWSKGIFLRRAGTYDDVARVNVDVRGRFVIPFVPAGEYDVVGWAAVTTFATRRIRVGSEDLDLGDVVVEPELKVPVVVVAPEGTKLAGKHYLHIEHEGGSTTGHLYLDEKGNGHMLGLRPGRCRVFVDVEGFPAKELVIEVARKDPATVRIELTDSTNR